MRKIYLYFEQREGTAQVKIKAFSSRKKARVFLKKRVEEIKDKEREYLDIREDSKDKFEGLVDKKGFCYQYFALYDLHIEERILNE